MIALLCALALTAQTPAPTTAPSAAPTANEVVFRALGRLHAYGTPPYVVYMTVENGEYHRIAFRGTDEMMNDVALPTGATLPDARIYRAFVGPLSRSVHEAVATPAPSATSARGPSLDLESTLKTIAVVSSRGHLYDVSVVGTQTVEGHHVYHIVLHPRKDPQDNALRDLWIDTDTYDVWRAAYVSDPGFTMPGGEADLTVDFTTVGSYRIASSWIAIYHGPQLHTPVYRQLRVVRMAFPETLPEWLFDEPSYAKRLHAHEPDYLGSIFNAPPSS